MKLSLFEQAMLIILWIKKKYDIIQEGNLMNLIYVILAITFICLIIYTYKYFSK